nr:HlyD family efflux transporter periplasmic adaptor subunit [Lachnospiraceae bacterium]
AIADAQTSVNNAQNAYDSAEATAINGYYTQQSTVLDSESARVTGELSRNTFEQEMSVENYEKQVEEGVITAPFSGVITAVNYEEGDTYAANTALITIQDVSGYEVKTEIGEYDIPDIKEGQKVIIKTKTTGDLEMTGHVKKVSPVATRQTITTAAGTTTTAATSNSTYEVVISIDDPSDRLRLDMNTNMSIIVDEHDDALTVPYTAVKTDDDGQAYVMVVDETTGEQVKTNVEVVMESNYYTQIKGDGIKEGMTVAIIKDEVSDGSDMEYYFGF